MTAETQANLWNHQHPFDGTRGVRLRYWPTFAEKGRPHFARSSAWVLGGHTAVILITGVRGCVALSHCRAEPIQPCPWAVEYDARGVPVRMWWRG